MKHHQYTMVLRQRFRTAPGPALSLTELAARCEVHPDLVERLARFGVVESVQADAATFPPEALMRLSRAVRLHHDLGVNWNDLALVLDLLDKIDELEAELERRS